jgi:hypothetical protein
MMSFKSLSVLIASMSLLKRKPTKDGKILPRMNVILYESIASVPAWSEVLLGERFSVAISYYQREFFYVLVID